MKRTLACALTAALLAAGTPSIAFAGPSSGRVDFGQFAPPDGSGEFVEIQIQSNLLSLAAGLVERQEPAAAQLLRSVESIHVNVIGLTDANRADLVKRVGQIRHDLEGRGWEHNVAVKDKNGQDVGIYTKTRGGEALAGLVVTVIDPKDAVVLVNIVGDIRPEQVAVLGDKLDIKPLKDVGAALKAAAPKEAAPEKSASQK